VRPPARGTDPAAILPLPPAVGLTDSNPSVAAGVVAAGAVDEVVGLVLRATVPGVALGEVSRRSCGRPPLPAEVSVRRRQAVCCRR